MRTVETKKLDVTDELGERIRARRTSLGVSLRTLASRSGFTPSFISQLENGKCSPSIASLERIAAALGATLGEVLGAAERRTPKVTRANERYGLTSGWSRARVEALGPVGAGHQLEPFMISLAPSGTSGQHPAAQGGDQFAIVFSGTVNLWLDGTLATLEPGDAATIPAGTSHRWENIGAGPAQIVIVTCRGRP